MAGNMITTPDNLAANLDDLCADIELTLGSSERGVTYETMPNKNMIKIFIVNPTHGFYDADEGEMSFEAFEKSDTGRYLKLAIRKFMGDGFSLVKAQTAEMSRSVAAGESDYEFECIDGIYIDTPVGIFDGRKRGRR